MKVKPTSIQIDGPNQIHTTSKIPFPCSPLHQMCRGSIFGCLFMAMCRWLCCQWQRLLEMTEKTQRKSSKYIILKVFVTAKCVEHHVAWRVMIQNDLIQGWVKLWVSFLSTARTPRLGFCCYNGTSIILPIFPISCFFLPFFGRLLVQSMVGTDIFSFIQHF